MLSHLPSSLPLVSSVSSEFLLKSRIIEGAARTFRNCRQSQCLPQHPSIVQVRYSDHVRIPQHIRKAYNFSRLCQHVSSFPRVVDIKALQSCPISKTLSFTFAPYVYVYDGF